MSSTTVDLGQTSSSSHEDTDDEQIGAIIEGQNSADAEDDNNGEDVDDAEDSRDKEMEESIAADITGDQLEAYDIDIELEGRVLVEYLDKLKSKING